MNKTFNATVKSAAKNVWVFMNAVQKRIQKGWCWFMKTFF